MLPQRQIRAPLYTCASPPLWSPTNLVREGIGRRVAVLTLLPSWRAALTPRYDDDHGGVPVDVARLERAAGHHPRRRTAAPRVVVAVDDEDGVPCAVEMARQDSALCHTAK